MTSGVKTLSVRCDLSLFRYCLKKSVKNQIFRATADIILSPLTSHSFDRKRKRKLREAEMIHVLLHFFRICKFQEIANSSLIYKYTYIFLKCAQWSIKYDSTGSNSKFSTCKILNFNFIFKSWNFYSIRDRMKKKGWLIL